jgi:uncharacterized protein YecE (DUF72 family)
MLRIGTAGWSVPASNINEGTHLYRYSRVLSCAEINSSFYRPHRPSTWAKWATETPADFRFSIKAPRTITHEARLRNTSKLLDVFFKKIEHLGGKMGPILFQLPPSLQFDAVVADEFFSSLRERSRAEIVLEPRHPSWFTSTTDLLLRKFTITRAAVDPPKGHPSASEAGGNAGLAYYRLHGTPRMYYSNYEDDFLEALANRIKSVNNVWVIFDNTALSYAYSNALQLQTLVRALTASRVDRRPLGAGSILT